MNLNLSLYPNLVTNLNVHKVEKHLNANLIINLTGCFVQNYVFSLTLNVIDTTTAKTALTTKVFIFISSVFSKVNSCFS